MISQWETYFGAADTSSIATDAAAYPVIYNKWGSFSFIFLPFPLISSLSTPRGSVFSFQFVFLDNRFYVS